MRYPDPPFLEYGFQFANLSGRDAIRRVAKVLLDGTKETRLVSAETMKASADILLGAHREQPRVQLKLGSSENLLNLLNNPEILVTKFVVDGAVQFIKDASEIVTLIPIESDDPRGCGNSVAICLEGASLSFPTSLDPIPGKLLKIGARARTIFIDLVCRLQPSYASITVDYGLEAPCDLERDPRTHAFRDFFLSSTVYRELIEDVISRFSTLHYDLLESGLLVTTTHLFSNVITTPSIQSVDPYVVSEYIGRRIAMI